MNRQLEARTSDQSPQKDTKLSPTGRAMPKKRTRATNKENNKNSQQQKELLARLSRLRITTKDISRVYLSKVEGEIAYLIETVGSGSGSKKKRWKTAHLEKMNDALDELNIKPEKGRRKDLKRIELVVNALAGLLSKKK